MFIVRSQFKDEVNVRNFVFIVNLRMKLMSGTLCL